jgi:hypothetical protein
MVNLFAGSIPAPACPIANPFSDAVLRLQIVNSLIAAESEMNAGS